MKKIRENFNFTVKTLGMKNLLVAFLVIFSSCSQTIYIVRHAEKAAVGTNMSSDVALSNEGKERAWALKEVLRKRKIAYIFSTNTLRAKATAQPTAEYFGLKIEIYNPLPDSSFINLLKSRKGNVLVVGHSNTAPDIVNMLCGEKKVPGDLKDSEYDKLFIVKKRGRHYVFSWEYYGRLTE